MKTFLRSSSILFYCSFNYWHCQIHNNIIPMLYIIVFLTKIKKNTEKNTLLYEVEPWCYNLECNKSWSIILSLNFIIVCILCFIKVSELHGEKSQDIIKLMIHFISRSMIMWNLMLKVWCPMMQCSSIFFLVYTCAATYFESSLVIMQECHPRWHHFIVSVHLIDHITFYDI